MPAARPLGTHDGVPYDNAQESSMPDKIVTANHLKLGEVVFLTADGGWTPDPSRAAVAADKAAQAQLMVTAERGVAGCIVVGPYLIDVTTDGGTIHPTRYRERIRVHGPSVTPDRGSLARTGSTI